MRALFRCDATRHIGLGHLSRSLNLADALRRRGADCRFASRPLEPGPEQIVRDRGYTLIPVLGEHADEGEELAGLAERWAADWLVVDHYLIDSATMTRATSGGARLCVIDEVREHDLAMADLVVDLAPEAEALRAGTLPPDLPLLGGPRYAMLHAAFGAARHQTAARPRPGDTPDVLVIMGGMDSAGLTGSVATQITEVWPGATVRAVTGASDANVATTKGRISLLGRQTPAELAALMQWANLAVATPSTVAYELSSLGLPAVLVQVADNQRDGAAYFAKHDLASVCQAPSEVAAALKSLAAESDEQWGQRVSRWAALCDGQGAGRVADKLLALSTT